jgi:hypothetical protein
MSGVWALLDSKEVAIGIICYDSWKPGPEIMNIVFIKEDEADKYCSDYNSKNNLPEAPDEYYKAERLSVNSLARFAKDMLK